MSQIYNGTFVLGNTSATTLSAQPGIKLDTSVPGVIGIGTDETVLWSGDSVSAECSEPISNFNKLRVELKTPAFSSMHEETFDVGSSAGFFTCGGGAHYYGGVISTTDTAVKVSSGIHVWFNSNGCGSETSNSKIQKVVGINRISGGN